MAKRWRNNTCGVAPVADVSKEDDVLRCSAGGGGSRWGSISLPAILLILLQRVSCVNVLYTKGNISTPSPPELCWGHCVATYVECLITDMKVTEVRPKNCSRQQQLECFLYISGFTTHFQFQSYIFNRLHSVSPLRKSQTDATSAIENIEEQTTDYGDSLSKVQSKRLSSLLSEDPAIMERRSALSKRLELYRSAQAEIDSAA